LADSRLFHSIVRDSRNDSRLLLSNITRKTVCHSYNKLRLVESQALDMDRLSTAVRMQRGSRTFDDAAEESGLDRSLLYRVERGKAAPSLQNYFALCDWLDMPADYFRRRELACPQHEAA
jgi:transcriptional regulator with XRE-family HTH domain